MFAVHRVAVAKAQLNRPTARLTSRGDSSNQRDTVRTPEGERRSQNSPQASAVYRPFSVSAKAPEAVAAQVSMSEAWMTS